MAMLGALIGAAIDRSDGDSGLKGAVIGAVASRALAVVPPVALGIAIIWALRRALRSFSDASPTTGKVLEN